MKIKDILRKAALFIWILLPFYLIYLPYNYFDTGKAMCLSVILFDLECLGCGLTRGVMRVLHLRILDALNYNWLSLPVTIFLGMVWIHVIGRLTGKNYFKFMRSWY